MNPELQEALETLRKLTEIPHNIHPSTQFVDHEIVDAVRDLYMADFDLVTAVGSTETLTACRQNFDEAKSHMEDLVYAAIQAQTISNSTLVIVKSYMDIVSGTFEISRNILHAGISDCIGRKPEFGPDGHVGVNLVS